MTQSIFMSVGPGQVMEINDIKFFTTTPGSYAVRNCLRTEVECRPNGTQSVYVEGNVLRCKLSGRVHIGIMHETHAVADARLRSISANPFDTTQGIQKYVVHSSASFVSRFRNLAGTGRELEVIPRYGMVCGSLFDLVSSGETIDEFLLYNVEEYDQIYLHHLHREDTSVGSGWSIPAKIKIPMVYQLTARGPCYLPYYNMREDHSVEFTLSSADEVFAPFIRGEPGRLKLTDAGSAWVAGKEYSMLFQTQDITYEYRFDDFYVLLIGITLKLGAGTNVANWYHDTLETSVCENTTSGQAYEDFELNLLRTSVQSIRSFFVDPRCWENQHYNCIPNDCFMSGGVAGHTAISGGHVVWFQFRHGGENFPTPTGCGIRYPPRTDFNHMDMSRARDIYTQKVAASVFLPGRSLQNYNGFFFPHTFGSGSRTLALNAWAGERFDPYIQDMHGATPGWRAYGKNMFWKEDAIRWNPDPSPTTGTRGYNVEFNVGGGKFMMCQVFGPFPEDMSMIQGRNTHEDKIRLQVQRTAAIPQTGTAWTETAGPEDFSMSHTALTLISVVHSFCTVAIEKGIMNVALFKHFLDRTKFVTSQFSRYMQEAGAQMGLAPQEARRAMQMHIKQQRTGRLLRFTDELLVAKAAPAIEKFETALRVPSTQPAYAETPMQSVFGSPRAVPGGAMPEIQFTADALLTAAHAAPPSAVAVQDTQIVRRVQEWLMGSEMVPARVAFETTKTMTVDALTANRALENLEANRHSMLKIADMIEDGELKQETIWRVEKTINRMQDQIKARSPAKETPATPKTPISEGFLAHGSDSWLVRHEALKFDTPTEPETPARGWIESSPDTRSSIGAEPGRQPSADSLAAEPLIPGIFEERLIPVKEGMRVAEPALKVSATETPIRITTLNPEAIAKSPAAMNSEGGLVASRARGSAPGGQMSTATMIGVSTAAMVGTVVGSSLVNAAMNRERQLYQMEYQRRLTVVPEPIIDTREGTMRHGQI